MLIFGKNMFKKKHYTNLEVVHRMNLTDYWKSNERKFCEFCKCWLSDNKASISFHENGKRHKLNVAKRLSEVSQKSENAEKERKKMDMEIRKMEDAAMRSYAVDIHSGRDMTAQALNTVMHGIRSVGPTVGTSLKTNNNYSREAALELAANGARRQVDPLRMPGNSDDEDDSMRPLVQKIADPESIPNASLWVEGKSPEGYTYYWNVKTNESVWKKPKEGYLSLEEYNRINEIALAQQELALKSEAQKFRDNANEAVARYNREKMKAFRQPDIVEEKAKKEIRETFKTEEEAAAGFIGSWQTVVHKPEPPPIDWELPLAKNFHPEPLPNIPENTPEPPVKRFKEKTIEALDPSLTIGTSTSFKKRKFSAKANARQRLDD